MKPYKLYISDVSYYSGKLEAFLRYKEIPHERIEVSARTMREEILPATGMMKVPVMECPDGRWLKDTTPMMQWLDREHPAHSVYPEDAATRFIALLVEDYADEWMWRPAMYYRWRFADSHRLLRHRLGHELSRDTWHSPWLLGWYMRWRQYLVFVRGDGVRRHNEPQVQAVYLDTLKQLETLLKSRPYLLGERPSIVDFGFFASMFRHFALDPYPARIMLARAPGVYAWVARLWNSRGSREGAGATSDFTDAAWDPVFRSIAADYLPYLDCNAQACKAGLKRFDFKLGAAMYPDMPVVRYRVACRGQLLKAWNVLDQAAKQKVWQRLETSGVSKWLATAETVDAGLDEEFEMPLRQTYREPSGLFGLRMYQGTPWDIPHEALAARRQRKQP